MDKLIAELTIDTKEIQPLLGVCRLQVEIINELSHLVSSEKIDELQRMFKAANIDEPLRKIQREAFEAGYSANNEGVISYDPQDAVDAFNEWVKL